MKLSIIIPCYNAGPYFPELINRLIPQLNNSTEIIVVDDGSDIPVEQSSLYKLLRQQNGGVSCARNTGLDNSQGEYIAFIDADDLVSPNYIETILSTIDREDPDYIYLSWETIGLGWQQQVRLNSVNDEFPPFNLCCWNRIYKRSIIGDIRFNTTKKIAEDAEFIRKVQTAGLKKSFISDYLYFYRSDAKNSLTKRFADGKVDTQRVVYYFKKVTPKMDYLIDEFKALDTVAEVILMTEENYIPELSQYAMVIKPQVMKGTELRGEFTRLFQKIEIPVITQIVIFTARTFGIGGIETWIYNFCKNMSKYYDITILYDSADEHQIFRLSQMVQCIKNDKKPIINCDTLIINRISDKAPENVRYKKKIQMVHACKMMPQWTVPTDADEIVCVSQVVKDSFDLSTGRIINNMTAPAKISEPLLLVTATRSTFEKGMGRITALADLLDKNGINYLWFVFSDKKISVNNHIINLEPTLDIQSYIKKADYLVQLSDQEGFCYSIVEALELGTAVLTTPIDVLPEIGFSDAENGYILPFNIADDKDIKRILNVPKFAYKYDNQKRIREWKKILGNTKPTHSYRPTDKVEIVITMTYFDTEFCRNISPGEIIIVTQLRANAIIEAGFARRKK